MATCLIEESKTPHRARIRGATLGLRGLRAFAAGALAFAAGALAFVVLVGGLGVLLGLAGLGLVGLLAQLAAVQDAASHDGLLSVRGENGTWTPGRGAAFAGGLSSGEPEGAWQHGRRLRACEDQGSSCSARMMTADPVRG